MEPQSKILDAGSTPQRVLLGGWRLHRGGARRGRLEVVADASGDEPVEVLLDGRPVALIDRPSAITGRQTKTRPISGVGELRVSLDSPDDGATIKCQVFVDGHRLNPTDGDVDLAALASPAQRRAWDLYATVSAGAIVAYLALQWVFGLLETLGLRNRGPLVIGVFVVALALFCVASWRLQRPVHGWIEGQGWSRTTRIAVRGAFLGLQLAAFACFLLVAGLVLRSF